MKNLKKIYLFLLFTGLISNAHALRVSELFVNGTLKNFEDVGFENPSSVKGKLELMFKDVFPQSEMTSDKLERIVSDLAKEDEFFKELDKALKLDTASVKFQDIEQAYIHSVMLSHIKGKNLVCENACSLSSAAPNDKIFIINFTDPNLLQIKNKLGEMSSTQQRNIVTKGLGGSIPSNLGPLEQKQLAFFFLMKKSKSKVQRKFVDAAEKLSLRDGKVDLLGFDSNFHKIPSTLDSLTDDELSLYTDIMEISAAKREVKPDLTIKEAFYNSLDDIINDKEISNETRVSLKKTKTAMQEKNCLFN